MPELIRRPRNEEQPMPAASLVGYGLDLIKSKFESDVSNVIIDVGILTRNKDQNKLFLPKLMLFLQTETREWGVIYYVYRAVSTKSGKPIPETMKKLFEGEVSKSCIRSNEFRRGTWEAELETLSMKELQDGEESGKKSEPEVGGEVKRIKPARKDKKRTKN